jgi:hypothetical protein
VERRAETIEQLDLVRRVALADALLLVPLVVAALTDAERLVSFLGPLHGLGFLVLLFLCARGAAERRWGWWFPVLVVVTLGPPGFLIGDLRIRRGMRQGGVPGSSAAPPA